MSRFRQGEPKHHVAEDDEHDFGEQGRESDKAQESVARANGRWYGREGVGWRREAEGSG